MKPQVILFAALGLAACNVVEPVEEPQGVGFGSYSAYRDNQIREIQQARAAEEQQAAQTQLNASRVAPPADQAPVEVASLATPVPQQTGPNNPNLSSEQDFDAVSAERDIQQDAARIAEARQQYQLVTPVDVQRPDETGPNIIDYALSTNHAIGTKLHRRGPLAGARTKQACTRYRTADTAQEAFLEAGGPERDRLGLDPDGDGFACAWDPATYRKLVRN